jgi:hypothetical protein
MEHMQAIMYIFSLLINLLAGGLYQPTTEILKSVRQEIDYKGEELEAIVSAKKLKIYWEPCREKSYNDFPKDMMKVTPTANVKDEILPSYTSADGRSCLTTNFVR